MPLSECEWLYFYASFLLFLADFSPSQINWASRDSSLPLTQSTKSPIPITDTSVLRISPRMTVWFLSGRLSIRRSFNRLFLWLNLEPTPWLVPSRLSLFLSLVPPAPAARVTRRRLETSQDYLKFTLGKGIFLKKPGAWSHSKQHCSPNRAAGDIASAPKIKKINNNRNNNDLIF